MAEQTVEYRTNVRQRLAGSRARRDDEILAGSAQLDGLDLMPIQRIASKNIGHSGMEGAGMGKLRHSASSRKGRVELQEWFRPQLAFAQLPLNDLQDRGIGNVEEAANVGCVVCNNAGMGLKNIHMKSLMLRLKSLAFQGDGWEQHSTVLPGGMLCTLYGLVLYGHRSPSMLVAARHARGEFTELDESGQLTCIGSFLILPEQIEHI